MTGHLQTQAPGSANGAKHKRAIAEPPLSLLLQKKTLSKSKTQGTH